MRKVRLSDLYRYVSVGELEFLPDGEFFIFVRRHMDKKENQYRSNIWIQGFNGRDLKQLTFGDSDFSPKISPDGKKLVFLSKRGEGSKKIGLYLLPLTGGEAIKIREFPGGVTNLRWIDNERVSFISYVGRTHSIGKEDDGRKVYEVERIPFLSNERGYTEGKTGQAFSLDLERNKLKQLTDNLLMNVVDILYSPDGDAYVLIIREDPEQLPHWTSLYYVNKGGRRLKLSPEGISVLEARWRKEDELFVIANDYSKGFATNAFVAVVDVNGNFDALTRNQDIPFFNVLNSDVRGVGGRQLKIHKGSLYILVTERYKSLLKKVDRNGNVETVLDVNASIDTFDISEKGGIIFTVSTSSKPLEIYKYHKGKSRKLTSFNRWLNTCLIPVPERFNVVVSDGARIDAWILKPPDFRADRKYPTILEIHGGPKTAYGNAYMHEFQSLASEGYIVLYCNPRGSHGYSSEFADIRGHYGERDFLDIMEVVEHAVNEFPFIDSERLGVTGGSYGGFMTNWIVTHTDIFEAAVSQRSISNFISFYGTTDIGYFFAEDQIGLSKAFWEDPEIYIRQSPLFYAPNVETPLLLIHSLEDYRCWVPEAMQFFTALRRLGKEVKMILFPRENHELSRSGLPIHREKRLKAIIDWFNIHLKEGDKA
ncbi:S9 family peptidase [Kosmotoga pacifica]|uniref:Peptidase S9 n=1 Tax=Kosmotoga pacifica TaxID=1330330 RepID=A0A0G2Z5G0_9BACT|nr:S9 family peptidase [Kosmotoga pacifica]AKI96855.1 peptidase S9 [Kosmotoga pacifica]